jgi:hypothetical protein
LGNRKEKRCDGESQETYARQTEHIILNGIRQWGSKAQPQLASLPRPRQPLSCADGGERRYKFAGAPKKMIRQQKCQNATKHA